MRAGLLQDQPLRERHLLFPMRRRARQVLRLRRLLRCGHRLLLVPCRGRRVLAPVGQYNEDNGIMCFDGVWVPVEIKA